MRNVRANIRNVTLISIWGIVGTISAANDLYIGDKNTGCKVFRPNVQTNESVVWTGKCLLEMADGPGIAQWFAAGKPTVSFSGTFRGGRLQGKGTMIAAGGDRYDGDYRDGMRDGNGTYSAASGERYEGSYKNNQRDGPGVLIDPTGRRIEGRFQAGAMVSQLPDATTAAKGGPPLANPSSSTSGATPASGHSGPVKIGQEATTPSGAILRIDTCGGYPLVVGVPPKSLDLKTSTASNSYLDTEAIGGVFPVIREAIELLSNSCKLNPNNQPMVYLFVNGLPPPGKLPPPEHAGTTAFDTASYVKVVKWSNSWQVMNGPSNLLQQQAKEKSKQETEKKQLSQAEAQREKRETKRLAFLRQHGANEIGKVGFLMSNPFSLEGKTIALLVEFHQMISPTVGRFTVQGDGGGTVVVTDIPKGAFLEPGYAFLAAKVTGLTAANQGREPQLKYVGAALCQRRTTFVGPEPSCP